MTSLAHPQRGGGAAALARALGERWLTLARDQGQVTCWGALVLDDDVRLSVQTGLNEVNEMLATGAEHMLADPEARLDVRVDLARHASFVLLGRAASVDEVRDAVTLIGVQLDEVGPGAPVVVEDASL